MISDVADFVQISILLTFLKSVVFLVIVKQLNLTVRPQSYFNAPKLRFNGTILLGIMNIDKISHHGVHPLPAGVNNSEFSTNYCLITRDTV